jgi:glycine/D-amino acid oxidase-like deaminating enzyme
MVHGKDGAGGVGIMLAGAACQVLAQLVCFGEACVEIVVRKEWYDAV